MPQTKSHIKNTKTILRNRNINKRYKLAIKQAIKKYLFSIKKTATNENIDKKYYSLCQENLALVYKYVDKAVNKNVLHKNTASRKKARLSKLLS
uniref:Ribosomal protein S20 n=1 Tax=Polysiphonia infestans TaxID=2006978 RepID=A0A1Z1MF21_9FLOR|nr:ribosomal protein S20 [Polysiphonia infestans]ARW64361.1 ribosomal protein S20 [Polysiphonia infestans]